MSDKRALITGITGQDGGHLAELLISKGYQVAGIIRGQQNPKKQAVIDEFPDVKIYYADLTDAYSLLEAVRDFQPTEVYNLAAISHVGYSFKNPELTHNVTGKGVLNMLEAIRQAGLTKTTKFYQASTSEMFGGAEPFLPPKGGYTENSVLRPRSPYGSSKAYGYNTTVNYRESYGMFACSGILFNHEGERRGIEFVTRKITDAVAKISVGKQEFLELGNMSAKRDWGYAGDYVKGMWLMLQQEEPDDYILATGETHSIKEFVELAFNEVDLQISWSGKGIEETGTDQNGVVRVKVNPEFFRPAEVDVLVGNPSKAEKILGWRRSIDFPGLVKLMVDKDISLQV